jgi:type II secretory pathway component PulF
MPSAALDCGSVGANLEIVVSKKRQTPDWGDEEDLPKGDPSLPSVPPEDWDPAQYATAAKPRPWRISHYMWLVCALAFLSWLYVTVGLFAIVVGAVVLIALLAGTGMILARQRSTQQDSLLWILAIAVERGMPLAPTLASFADQFRGAYRRRIMNLAAHLNWGTPLPEALEKVRRVVSRDAILMAHVGQETGRLPQALRATASARSSQLPIWAAIASRFSYLLGVLLAIQAICGFLLYSVVPKFESIFKDFGVSLPPVTILLIEGSHYLIKYGFFSAWVPPLEIMLLLFIPFSFAGWINYDVPFFDRLLKRRHLALILRALALVVEAGKPIETGLSILASHYPTWWVRRKLIKANSAVRRGEPWIDALWRQGLMRATDAEVLSTSGEVGNLAWAMRELSETTERRLVFRFQAVLQTIFPLVVVNIGVGVFFLAVAFFAPLTELIRRLAE